MDIAELNNIDNTIKRTIAGINNIDILADNIKQTYNKLIDKFEANKK